jgi:hypothetical protein
MKVLPEIAIDALKLAAARELTRNVHPEDMRVYDQGLSDGTQITAEYVIAQLQDAPTPEVPVVESESE